MNEDLRKRAGGADGLVELAGHAAALLHGAEGGEAFDSLRTALLDAFDFVDLVADEFEEAGHDLAQEAQRGQGDGDGGDVGPELGALVGVVDHAQERAMGVAALGVPGGLVVGVHLALAVAVLVLTGIPAGSVHDGGRIAFGPDGKRYVTTGESGDPGLAQDRSSLGGTILRINAHGSTPADNPDPASPVWSFGHRNIQGLAWDSAGRLWVTEYGANRLDELNLIQPGGNYGWPMPEGRADTAGLIDPAIEWSVGEASPSGLAYFGGSLWGACLRGQRLYRVPVGADGSVGDPAPLFVGQYGRLRTVIAAPDGALWLTTSNRDGRGSPHDGDDRILQFPP